MLELLLNQTVSDSISFVTTYERLDMFDLFITTALIFIGVIVLTVVVAMTIVIMTEDNRRLQEIDFFDKIEEYRNDFS